MFFVPLDDKNTVIQTSMEFLADAQTELLSNQDALREALDNLVHIQGQTNRLIMRINSELAMLKVLLVINI